MRAPVPCTTYRLQLRPGFGFAEAERQLPRLDALGVTDLYLSPIWEARPGSEHGYDVTDHGAVRAELGGEAGLRSLCEASRARGLGVVLDIVPNHMCIAGDANQAWLDVLENGPSSRQARTFDIDWHPPKQDLRDAVLLPVLGDQYGEVLESGGLAIEVDDGAPFVRFYETRLPLAPRSWPALYRPVARRLRSLLGPGHEQVQELESILSALEHLPSRTERSRARVVERRREREVCRRRLQTLLDACPEARALTDEEVARLNGTPGDPRSFDALDELLSQQGYRLAHWRTAADEINYRRFFDINDLAAIRVEDPAVFAAVHEIPLRLVREGLVTGLRIDHIDGLREPGRYLSALAEACGDRPVWIVVEKILAGAGDEALARDWPVAGTTGYDFLARLTGLFVDGDGGRALLDGYRRFTGDASRFADVAYEAKKLIQRLSLSSELTVLSRMLDRISEQRRHTRDFTLATLHHALSELIACFPVYRTYAGADDQALSDADEAHLRAALAEARRRNPATSRSLFEFLASVCRLQDPPDLDAEPRALRRDFVLRLQQLTSPIMAKAVEDTACYRFAPLAALAEVGCHPEPEEVAPSAFHAFVARRAAEWPATMNATSTHDTKRSEDVRARLLALSEMPHAWTEALARWHEQNAPLRAMVHGEPAPEPRMEQLLYQSLLGLWPAGPGGAAAHPDEAQLAELGERLTAYALKAAREAKLRTSWVDRDEAYEQVLVGFVRGLLDAELSRRFLADFAGFAAPIARAGLCTSLAQLVLKAAAPGVCDLYQGCETLALALVDPDNRSPVDHARLGAELEAVMAASARDPAGTLAAAMQAFDPRLKLAVTRQALRLRRARRELFADGDYRPIEVLGARARHAIAFERRLDGNRVIAVTGRLFASLGTGERAPVGACWRDTALSLGDGHGDAAAPLVDAFTGVELRPRPDGGGRALLPLDQVLARLPVALLEARP